MSGRKILTSLGIVSFLLLANDFINLEKGTKGVNYLDDIENPEDLNKRVKDILPGGQVAVLVRKPPAEGKKHEDEKKVPVKVYNQTKDEIAKVFSYDYVNKVAAKNNAKFKEFYPDSGRGIAVIYKPDAAVKEVKKTEVPEPSKETKVTKK